MNPESVVEPWRAELVRDLLIDLTNQRNALAAQVELLTAENATLRAEVARLQEQVAALGGLLDKASVFRSEHMASKTLVVDPATFDMITRMFPRNAP